MLNKRKDVPDLSYEYRVLIFDANCIGCPYARFKVISSTPYTGNKKVSYLKNLADAGILAGNTGKIERVCTFNDEEFSLKEITSNGCEFWTEGEHDEGQFIELTEIEITELWKTAIK